MNRGNRTSGYLLDTNAFSEITKRTPDSGFIAWLETADNNLLYTSCLVIGEGLRGASMVRDPTKHSRLTAFWNAITDSFTGKALPIDMDVCTIWATLSADAAKRGKPAPYADSLLAAQALQYNLTIVTRNTKDFAQFPGIVTLSPWN